MGKVTGKLQITLPKHLAEQHGIRVGDELAFESRGEVIAVVPARVRASQLTTAQRLQHFDEATRRQRSRPRRQVAKRGDRGWAREELYERDRPR